MWDWERAGEKGGGKGRASMSHCTCSGRDQEWDRRNLSYDILMTIKLSKDFHFYIQLRHAGRQR